MGKGKSITGKIAQGENRSSKGKGPENGLSKRDAIMNETCRPGKKLTWTGGKKVSGGDSCQKRNHERKPPLAARRKDHQREKSFKGDCSLKSHENLRRLG